MISLRRSNCIESFCLKSQCVGTSMLCSEVNYEFVPQKDLGIVNFQQKKFIIINKIDWRNAFGVLSGGREGEREKAKNVKHA